MKKVFDFFVGGLFAIALILYSGMALARYSVPALTVDWSDEIVVMLIIWAILLTGYRAVLDHSHIAIDFLTHKCPVTWQRRLSFVSTLSLVIYAGGMTLSGMQVVYDAWILGERTESTAQVPTFIYYASLPTGMFLMAAAASGLLVRGWVSFKKPRWEDML